MILRHLRLLPLLVLISAACLVMRVDSFVHGVTTRAYAEAAKEAVPEVAPKDAGAKTDTAPAVAAPAGNGAAVPTATGSSVTPSPFRDEMIAELVERRKALEERERQLHAREALLEAAEREIEAKAKELETLKSQIEALLVQQRGEQDQQIDSLVKIYEGMKAKDAALIFDSLEMPVLLGIISRMSERKSAPILAAMNPERAKTVTTLLAEKNTMPSLGGSAGEPLLPTSQ